MKDDELITQLVSEGVLTPEQLKLAQDEAVKRRVPLLQTISDLRLASKDEIYNIEAQVLGVVYIDLENYIADTKLKELIPEVICRKYTITPLFKLRNSITIATSDPLDLLMLDQLGTTTGLLVECVYAPENEIKSALDKFYGQRDAAQELAAKMGEVSLKPAGSVLTEVTKESPVAKLVDLIISQAVRDRASDIHIEPDEKFLRIRFRIDGVLHEIPSPPKHLELPIISRIKVLCGMDIAESRLPQDGHFQITTENRLVDMRISSFPTVAGENVVIRLLDTAGVLVGLEKLGFNKELLKKYEDLILRPYGIILTTGPTGSGKTTTLYSSLMRINSVDRNIITIEDPVEYRLGLIRQSQVNLKAGLTFANGLRFILRQDPDVIMVGEIRDLETAVISIQAALTGHLVFSTLHTNDAASAITRLENMGVEPFLISASTIGVMAQRLVRLVCTECKEAYDPSPALLKKLDLKAKGEIKFYQGKGCAYCKGTGYRGRTGIYELMMVDDELREMILQGSSTVAIREKARGKGMRLLRDDGLDKVLKGITTWEEVSRATEDKVEIKPPAQMQPVERLIAPAQEPAPEAPRAEVKIRPAEIDEYEKRIASWLIKKT